MEHVLVSIVKCLQHMKLNVLFDLLDGLWVVCKVLLQLLKLFIDL